MERDLNGMTLLGAVLLGMVAVASCGVSGGKAKDFDESKVVLSLAVVSDVHINTGVPATSEKWALALRQLSAKAAESDPDGLDGVLVAGDLIDYPSEKFIGEFKSVYESVLDPEKVPLFYTIGNHDVPKYRWDSTMVSDAAYIRKALGETYFRDDLDKEAGEGLECRHRVFGKYHVLAVSPDRTSPVRYSTKALEWLKGKLDEITGKDSERYVILITHPMLYDTVYGSLLGEADGIWKSRLPGYWATRELPELLKKYPQVVTFGGHLHFPLNDPRSVWQGSFTALGCASVRYMALEAGGYEDMAGQTVMKDKDEFSQGNLLQFDSKGNMRIFRMDFYNEAIIGEPLTFRRPRKDGRHLAKYSFSSRRERNEAPSLQTLEVEVFTRGAGAGAGCGADAKTGTAESLEGRPCIAATFASGTDDEFVHHYVLTLGKDGREIATKKILADFYKHPLPSGMKPEWKVDFDTEGLEAGEYSVTLTAFDSWDAGSEPLQRNVPILAGEPRK